MNDKEITIPIDGWSMFGFWVFFLGSIFILEYDGSADKGGLFICLLIASAVIASVGRPKDRDSSAGH